jgi:hypothetical protein
MAATILRVKMHAMPSAGWMDANPAVAVSVDASILRGGALVPWHER